MAKITNLEAVKRMVRAFLYLDIHPTDIPFIVSHPIFELSSTRLPGIDKTFNLLSEEDLKEVRKHYLKVIEESDLLGLYMSIRTPYKLTFLKHIMNYLSVKDFSRYLADAWIISENPNQDVNCPISLLIKMFYKADKSILMTKSDFEYYTNLPERIHVYRGVAVGRNPRGISWTDNFKKAEWFANRFNKEDEVGYIQRATINKSEVLAYFNTRNEQELVCDIRKIKIERL